MILSSFCGVLTLQVGTATLAVVYLLISALVIGINAFNYSNDPLNSWPLPIMLLTIFAIIMVVTGIIIFSCAYSESRTMCVVALVFVMLLWFYWVILSGLSLMNKPSFARRICHGNRCPETFWIANFKYRKINEDEILKNSSVYLLKSVKSKSLYQDILINNIRKVRMENTEKTVDLVKQPAKDLVTIKSLEYTSPKQHKRTCTNNCSFSKNTFVYSFLSPIGILRRKEDEFSNGNLLKELSYDRSETDLGNTDDVENFKEQKDDKYFRSLGSAFVGAILFFIGNSMFFGFTTLVLWAFAQEIQSKAPLLKIR